jgi:DNA-binding PucR family transcriptional regulator
VTAPGPAVAVSPAVRDLAAGTLADSARLAAELTAHLFAAIPELGARDDGELRDETRASCDANLAQVLRLLALGAGPDALVVPAEAADWARGLVRRGIGLAALLRAYRLGHGWFWDRWSQALNERLTDTDELIAAQDESSAFMFAYIDLICDALVGEYGDERERMLRSAEHVRVETVRAILGGEAIDAEVAGRRLGYELHRHHVALRVSSRGGELRGLERAATEAAAALGAGEPLIVPSGVASLDVWCGSYAPAVPAELEAYAPPQGIGVAVGNPGHGIAGFRRSHAEAARAARIVALARDTAMPVATYARLELVALLAGDLPSARAFVRGRLGALASLDEPCARLRETVLAFLTAGGSGTRVAKQLHVHQNTVAYRVKRAEELLGRRVSENPIELVCALTLAGVLGRAVLAEDAPRSG